MWPNQACICNVVRRWTSSHIYGLFLAHQLKQIVPTFVPTLLTFFRQNWEVSSQMGISMKFKPRGLGFGHEDWQPSTHSTTILEIFCACCQISTGAKRQQLLLYPPEWDGNELENRRIPAVLWSVTDLCNVVMWPLRIETHANTCEFVRTHQPTRLPFDCLSDQWETDDIGPISCLVLLNVLCQRKLSLAPSVVPSNFTFRVNGVVWGVKTLSRHTHHSNKIRSY